MRWAFAALLTLAACKHTTTPDRGGPADEREIVEVLMAKAAPSPGFVVDDAPVRMGFECTVKTCSVDPKLWYSFEIARHDGHLPALPPRLDALKDGGPELHKAYVGPAILSFSPVGFLGQRAIASVSYTCGGLCGWGFTCVLEHDSTGWHIVEMLQRWVS